jgi:hypothetical protein
VQGWGAEGGRVQACRCARVRAWKNLAERVHPVLSLSRSTRLPPQRTLSNTTRIDTIFVSSETGREFRRPQRLPLAASSRTLGPQLTARCWVGSDTATATAAVAAVSEGEEDFLVQPCRGRGRAGPEAEPNTRGPGPGTAGPGTAGPGGRGQGEGAEPALGGPRRQFVSSAVAGPSLAALDSTRPTLRTFTFPTIRASLTLTLTPGPESLHPHSTA